MDFWEFIEAYKQGYEEGYMQARFDLIEEEILKALEEKEQNK